MDTFLGLHFSIPLTIFPLRFSGSSFYKACGCTAGIPSYISDSSRQQPQSLEVLTRATHLEFPVIFTKRGKTDGSHSCPQTSPLALTGLLEATP